MARFKVEAEVLMNVITEFEEADGEVPSAETVEFCLLEDLQDTHVWEVTEIKTLRFRREEIPDD